MTPSAIRVFPLSRTKEPKAFGTKKLAFNFFCKELRGRELKGQFYIPSDSKFIKNSLVLFQFIENGQERIIADAILASDGCISDNKVKGYIGYYIFNKINFYNNFVTNKEIYDIWRKSLSPRAKLNLNITKYYEYINLLKRKGNVISKCK